MPPANSPSNFPFPSAPIRPRVNAHIHLPPNFSAFQTTSQAVKLADEQGIGVLGASNYYDYSVYVDFAAQSAQVGIFPLFGVEIITRIESLMEAGVRINDPGNPGKMYLCGKGVTHFNPLSARAQPLLQVIRENDAERMAVMTAKLASVFAHAGLETGLDANRIKTALAARYGCSVETVYLQERHLAQAFQEALFRLTPFFTDRAAAFGNLFGEHSVVSPEDAAAVQNQIRSHFMKAGKPAFVTETFVGFDHAKDLILALGGIPCYPVLADGVSPITQYEQAPEALVADLQARGVLCAEFIPARNTPEALSRYVTALRAAGLFVTAGTEHNTPELLPMEPACAGGIPVPGELQEIFWEGACVVAAHQSLAVPGQTGFVDAAGKPNSAYADDNARIAAFAEIGATAIARYQTLARP